MPARRILPCGVVIALSVAAAAQPAALAARLATEYQGKVLTLRAPAAPHGRKIHFSSQGELLQGDPSTWTVDGLVAVQNLALKRHALEIRGLQVTVVFPRHDDRTQFLPDRKRKVTITLDLPPNAEEATVMQTLFAVFLRDQEPLAPLLPPFWRPLLERRAAGAFRAAAGGEILSGAKTQSGAPVWKAGKDVRPPRRLYAPRPAYSNLALSRRMEGVVRLYCVVNERGAPEQLHIISPLGYGLDEMALEAVSTWRFLPGTRQGRPVPVATTIDVIFRLY